MNNQTYWEGRMNETTRQVKQWFWPWQDEAEEAWLRKMSQAGWHLSKADLFGQYTFTAGEPRDTVYRLDYQGKESSDLQDYMQLFRDAGWEHVSAMGGWHYFRKLAQPGDALEIFTDVESKIEKYERLLVVLFLPFFLLNIVWMYLNTSQYPVFGLVLAALYGLIAYIALRIFLRIRELRRMKKL